LTGSSSATSSAGSDRSSAAEVHAEPLVRDTYLITRAGGDTDTESQRRLLAAG